MAGNGKALASLVACAILCLSGCTENTVTPAPTDTPSVVSLNPCIDAILAEVADPKQILALSHYSRDPASSSMDVGLARQFGVTGGTAEEVIALAPDLVLGSAFMDPATRAALERAGLQVETFGSPQTVSDSVEQVHRLAALAGRPAASQPLAKAMTQARWPLKNPPELGPTWQPDPAPSAVLWQQGEIVAGQQTVIAQLLREEGFVSHAEQLGLGQADHLALEQIVANPPDVLLIAGSSAGQDHPVLHNLKNTWVRRFDPSLLYCGGPSILKARDELHSIRLSVAGLRG